MEAMQPPIRTELEAEAPFEVRSNAYAPVQKNSMAFDAELI
jgi:hypothetical protein